MLADTNPTLPVQRVCDLLLAKWVIEELKAIGDNEGKFPQTETMLSFEDSPSYLSKHTQTGLMCFNGLSNKITQTATNNSIWPSKEKDTPFQLKDQTNSGKA